MKGFDLPVRFTLMGLPAGVCGDTRVSFPGRSPCLAGCVSGAAGGWDVQCHPAAIPSPRALAQPRGMHTIHQPTSCFKLCFPKLLHPALPTLLASSTHPASLPCTSSCSPARRRGPYLGAAVLARASARSLTSSSNWLCQQLVKMH